MSFRLLDAFAALFQGQPYFHRISNQGDAISVEFYEDLYSLGHSAKFNDAADKALRGIGPKNKAVTKQRMRRGDGTFGLLVDRDNILRLPNYHVPRGAVATIDIGVEVKILNKAMMKQVDRVVGDLEKQVKQWERITDKDRLLSIAIIGINWAAYTVSYEGQGETARIYKTGGGRYAHPIDEAPKVLARIQQEVIDRDFYDEVLILNYAAHNEAPFDFSWVNLKKTREAYRASLLRIADKFQRHF